ncbi:Sip1-related alpha-galactosidase [Pontiella sulfatireligans]|uniref:Uncharacterized protein n=1 Tax=Pontiella sulfatireligans TaxID=2750658 RepID=A0A6C2UFK7_9BACT|nr:Sip1-related alpha-galactosidase [Pontiella sulfatireligans]VGO18663.1 hypothetical protein SCARR_00716 [Pontiella sulfatireligans]
MNLREFVSMMAVGLALQGWGAGLELDMVLNQDGVAIHENFSGAPDALGVLGQYSLKLPAYDRGVYYQGGWWPSGGNRVYSRVIRPHANGTVDILEVHDQNIEGGIFAIFELTGGGYLALLPLSGTETYSWLNVDGGTIQERENREAPTGEYECLGGTLELKFGHHGAAAISNDLPICAWARGGSPYEAAAKVWEQAADPILSQGRFKLREEKAYPEIFRYLGWCSWDCIGMDVNETNMVDALQGLHESTVPIRWALMDDGHYDKLTLLNDTNDFPNSYGSMMQYRTPEKLKWMGIWYAMFGNFGATPPNDAWDAVSNSYEVVNSRMMPKNDLESARTFFRHIFREGKTNDFDFLKTDFQTFNIKFFGGVWPGRSTAPSGAFANPYAASINAQQGFHEVVDSDFSALINCNWHNAPSLFGSFDSIVGRCSEDNKGGEQDAISHTFHAFSSTPWLGQVSWGDHDMFHSGDSYTNAARFNVIAKAVSGSSIYLSEYAEDINREYVEGLCYQDGLLLRPLAPAAPLPEDLFHQMYDDRLSAAIAPLPNSNATLVVYNTHRRGPQASIVYSRTFTEADYAEAGGMIQPYSGPWSAPDEGLLVYDWYNKSARKMEAGCEVSLVNFDYRVLQLSPIQNGWSVVGRTDKYLSAAAVKSVQAGADMLVVELHRSGPLTIWSERGYIPQAGGMVFTYLGDGLFTADLPVANAPVRLEITDGAMLQNNRPVAEPSTVTVLKNDSVAIVLTGADLDDDTLSYMADDQPRHGTLVGTAPSLTYFPDADFIGADRFTFTASDGQTNSAEATVPITVEAESVTATAEKTGPISPSGGAHVLAGGEGSQTRQREVIRTDTQQIAIGQSFSLAGLPPGGGQKLSAIYFKSASAENFDAYSGQLQIKVFAGTQNSSNELATYSCNLASFGDGTSANEVDANDWVRFSLGSGLVLDAVGTYSFLMFFDESSGSNQIHKWGFRRDNSGIYTEGTLFECTSYAVEDWNSNAWNNVLAMNSDDFMFYVSGAVVPINVDSDGDGLTDSQEIALGTNRADPESVFGFTGVAPFPVSGMLQLTWPAKSGVLYRLWESPDLADWAILRDWTNALTFPSDVHEVDLATSVGFFKIEARIQ